VWVGEVLALEGSSDAITSRRFVGGTRSELCGGLEMATRELGGGLWLGRASLGGRAGDETASSTSAVHSCWCLGPRSTLISLTGHGSSVSPPLVAIRQLNLRIRGGHLSLSLSLSLSQPSPPFELLLTQGAIF
jgi:hypothetical protein